MPAGAGSLSNRSDSSSPVCPPALKPSNRNHSSDRSDPSMRPSLSLSSVNRYINKPRPRKVSAPSSTTCTAQGVFLSTLCVTVFHRA
uniref:Uncharacterized protein n=1 Tax=Kalanchoe fedtschenkoi TaxID=63787 RepID=A0A7N0V3P3_KALFE